MAMLSERHLFRADNTDGYDADDLEVLNLCLEMAWEREQAASTRELDPDGEDKSLLDHVAERVAFGFDAGSAGPSDEACRQAEVAAGA
jgi:hypothetical protein